MRWGGVSKATGSRVYKHGKVCVQWDIIMLQCLWRAVMCAMCFYELIKAAVEAKLEEMMEGGEGRRRRREMEE